MTSPFEWWIGWRYLRAARSARGDNPPGAGRGGGFISFISAVSMAGIALGVAALIIVLSVMNGFQQEVRERILALLAHVQVVAADEGALPDWRATAALAQQDARVQAAAPFVAFQALLAPPAAAFSPGAADLQGASVRGIEPALEAGVTPLARALLTRELAALTPGAWNAVIGGELARRLNLRVGQRFTLMLAGGQVTPAGVVRQFTLAGTFESGHGDSDAGLVLIHLEDARRLARLEGASGVQLRLADVQQARALADALAARLPPELEARDWTRVHRHWFEAVQIEKRVMFIVLSLIVAVAAFNLVSTLVMTVTDKRADIAILRTLGASPASVMALFVVQGAAAGLVGTALGAAVGVLVAWNIGAVVAAIEQALGLAVLPGSIYLLTRMPSQVQAGDVGPVVAVALAFSLLMTLYPSWRASRLNPAESLRYE
jgi:lipoprotein-releasing system permease protein